MDVQILFEDGYLTVACKPYGVFSEDGGKKPNMPDMLREKSGGEIYAVHRLDRTTQGLMVYAKTREAARRLSAMALSSEIEKIYLAVVEGAPEQPSAELEDLLYYDRSRNKSFVVKRERKGVKLARLYYETLGSIEAGGSTVSLLRIRLYTGRTHQIRVQLGSRQMPIVGDRRYGSSLKSENIMLCSSELRFTHPFTGKEMDFVCLPEDGLFREFPGGYDGRK